MQGHLSIYATVPNSFAAGSEEDIRQKVHDAFTVMMGRLHQQQGAVLDIQIMADPAVTDFIDTHSSVLDSAIKQQPMSDGMRHRLQRSNYIFSGMKAFHELNEAFPSLLDENGNRKPFERFLNDVQKIDSTYNRNYLRAEYNFVQASAEMAAKWESFMEDGDHYNLQYRTQNDSHVRPEHAELHGVTLPPSDSFWEEYYPPNGWNCRCTVVQVRKSKYPATPHDEAVSRGEAALQRDTRGMFRFNPGIEKKTVPDYNPYTIKRCNDCDIASKLAAFIPDNEVCAACKLVRQCYRNKGEKEERARIEDNRKLYDRLSKDSRYINVEFNSENGALKATHRGHNMPDGCASGKDKEIILVDKLYQCGHSVILCDEKKKGGNGKTMCALDMILDGVRMDIASIEVEKPFYGSPMIRKNLQLVKYNSRSDVHDTSDTLCMYFDDPKMFEPQKITKGYEYMLENTKIPIHLKHVICAINSAKGLEIKRFDF